MWLGSECRGTGNFGLGGIRHLKTAGLGSARRNAMLALFRPLYGRPACAVLIECFAFIRGILAGVIGFGLI